MTDELPRRSSHAVIHRLLPLVLLAAGGTVVLLLGWDDYLSLDALRDNRARLLAWHDAYPLASCVLFMAVYAAVVALSVPGAAWLTVAGGFVYGAITATVLVVVAASAGAAVIFLAARHAFAEQLRARAGPAIRRMETGFRDNALSYMLFLRLIPVFPFWLVNLVPAFLGVPLRTYLLGTVFGIVPGTVVYSLVGSGLGAVLDAGGEPEMTIIFSPHVLAPLVGLALLALLPVGYKRFRSATDAPSAATPADDQPGHSEHDQGSDR